MPKPTVAPRRTPNRAATYAVGAVLTASEMTQYILRHRLRNGLGRIDERTAKETISFAADYWRLELIDISDFPIYEIDPDYPNRSMRAHPIVHYFNSSPRAGIVLEVLDGLHRLAMARRRGETSVLAWVGHDGTPE